MSPPYGDVGLKLRSKITGPGIIFARHELKVAGPTLAACAFAKGESAVGKGDRTESERWWLVGDDPQRPQKTGRKGWLSLVFFFVFLSSFFKSF